MLPPRHSSVPCPTALTFPRCCVFSLFVCALTCRFSLLHFPVFILKTRFSSTCNLLHISICVFTPCKSQFGWFSSARPGFHLHARVCISPPAFSSLVHRSAFGLRPVCRVCIYTIAFASSRLRAHSFSSLLARFASAIPRFASDLQAFSSSHLCAH